MFSRAYIPSDQNIIDNRPSKPRLNAGCYVMFNLISKLMNEWQFFRYESSPRAEYILGAISWVMLKGTKTLYIQIIGHSD